MSSRFQGTAGWLAQSSVIALTVLSGCFGPTTAQLEIGPFQYALAAERSGGFSMLFNFTVYNNGTVDARNVYVRVDGLNRTPPDANHYGVWERTLQGIPSGRRAVMTGSLESIESCSPFGAYNRECASGEAYFTIRIRPENGPEVVRVEKELNY